MQGDLNLLKEMKTIRGVKMEERELPETVAGANGEKEVVEKFREVYSTLYNSAESEKEMEDLMTKVLSQIKGDSDGEVGKMTAAKVKEAAGGGAVTFVSLVFFMFQSILNIFVLFLAFFVGEKIIIFMDGSLTSGQTPAPPLDVLSGTLLFAPNPTIHPESLVPG